MADIWTVASATDNAAPAAPVVKRAAPAPVVGPSPDVAAKIAEEVSSSAAAVDSAEQVPETTVAPKPKSAPVVEKGNGKFTTVAVPAEAAANPVTTGRIVRYTVEVEGGLGVDNTAVAATIATTLKDPRGWQTKDKVRFVNVSPEQVTAGARVDVHVTLASPDTVDRLCAPLQTRGQVSCHNGGRVALNLRRWQLGAEAYGTDVASYRTYLVNHEVGHAIGHGHEYCAGKGAVAPVMMQQTYGLKGCTAWPWPTAKP